MYACIVSPSRPKFWALIGFVHGLLAAFSLPNQSPAVFVASGLIYAILWLALSALVLLLMRTKYRHPFGIFCLVSGLLIIIGSRTNPEYILLSLGILQLAISIPLLLPSAIRRLRKSK